MCTDPLQQERVKAAMDEGPQESEAFLEAQQYMEQVERLDLGLSLTVFPVSPISCATVQWDAPQPASPEPDSSGFGWTLQLPDPYAGLDPPPEVESDVTAASLQTLVAPESDVLTPSHEEKPTSSADVEADSTADLTDEHWEPSDGAQVFVDTRDSPSREEDEPGASALPTVTHGETSDPGHEEQTGERTDAEANGESSDIQEQIQGPDGCLEESSPPESDQPQDSMSTARSERLWERAVGEEALLSPEPDEMSAAAQTNHSNDTAQHAEERQSSELTHTPRQCQQIQTQTQTAGLQQEIKPESGLTGAQESELIEQIQANQSESSERVECSDEEKLCEQTPCDETEPPEDSDAPCSQKPAPTSETRVEQELVNGTVESGTLDRTEALDRTETEALDRTETEALDRTEIKALDQTDALDRTETEALDRTETEALDRTATEALDQTDALNRTETEALDQTDALDRTATEALDQTDALDRTETEALDQTDALNRTETEALDQTDALDRTETEALDQTDALDRTATEALDQTDALNRTETKALDQTDALDRTETEALDQNATEALDQTEALDLAEAQRLAQRLYKLDGFQRTDVVRHLDKDNEFSRAVGEEYLKFFEFSGQSLERALRSFLTEVVLIGETQERERVLQHFCARFHQCNPDSFSSAGSALALTCALMLLNTDLHGQNVGKPMSSADFVSNLEGMNGGENFSKDQLKSLYSSIKSEPLQWAVDEDLLAKSMMLEPDAEQDGLLRSKSNPFQDLPHDTKATVFQKGFLKRKAHADIDGKRTPWGKRSWKTFYAMLKGMVLYLQKVCLKLDISHEDDYVKDCLSSEEVVSVHHALAEPALHYTKRPHVFRLQTADWRVFLFEAATTEQMNSWIGRINLVSALYSSPPFPAAVGSQRRFCRPILPATQSSLAPDKQLQSHAAMLQRFQEDLSALQQGAAEGRRSRAREQEELRQREEYLQYEKSRYEAYLRVLELWQELERPGAAAADRLPLLDAGLWRPEAEETDESDGAIKRSHSSPSLELETPPPPAVKVRRNISERRTYRKIVILRRNKEL